MAADSVRPSSAVSFRKKREETLPEEGLEYQASVPERWQLTTNSGSGREKGLRK
jgi:hypothetical protein